MVFRLLVCFDFYLASAYTEAQKINKDKIRNLLSLPLSACLWFVFCACVWICLCVFLAIRSYYAGTNWLVSSFNIETKQEEEEEVEKKENQELEGIETRENCSQGTTNETTFTSYN